MADFFESAYLKPTKPLLVEDLKTDPDAIAGQLKASKPYMDLLDRNVALYIENRKLKRTARRLEMAVWVVCLLLTVVVCVWSTL